MLSCLDAILKLSQPTLNGREPKIVIYYDGQQIPKIGRESRMPAFRRQVLDKLRHRAADNQILLDLCIRTPRGLRPPRVYVGPWNHDKSPSTSELIQRFHRLSRIDPRSGREGSSLIGSGFCLETQQANRPAFVA